MSGVRPTEGQVALSELTNQGATRAPNQRIGLWRGTWDGEMDVTYTEASARFTKVADSGLEERDLLDANAVVTPAASTTATAWPMETFTAGAGVSGAVVNGAYIATTIGGITRLRALERDPIARSLSDGDDYDVTPGLIKS